MNQISWTTPHFATEPGRQTDTDVQKDVDKDEMLWVEPPYRVLIHNDMGIYASCFDIRMDDPIAPR